MAPFDNAGPNPVPLTSTGPGAAAEANSAALDIRFARNSVRPFARVPIILGRIKVVPPLAAEPVSETTGGDVFQTLPLLWGHGPLEISDLKINNADISEYSDIDAGAVWPGILSNIDDLATTILKVRITDQLPRQLVDISGIAESSCPDWNGAAWVERHTVNPASLYRYVLQHPGRRYPIADSGIDLDTLQDFHDFCEGLDYEFSAIIDYEISLWDLLREICSVARATPRRENGKWSVVWDSGAQAVGGHITGANAGRFALRKSFAPPSHGMRVRFSNREKDWQRDERLVYRDGYDAATAERIVEASPLGITDVDHAWRYATYQLAQSTAPERWSAQQGLESLEVVRGMRVTVQHDSLATGIATVRVKGVQTNPGGEITAIDLEEPVRLDEAGATYKAKLRTISDPDLRLDLDEDGAETVSQVALAAASSETVEAGDLITIGTDGDLVEDALVTAVERGDELTATVSMVPFDADVYTAVEADPPVFVSNLSDLPSLLPPIVVTAAGAGQNQRHRIGNVFESRIALTITPIPVAGAIPEVQIREAADDPWGPADTRTLSPSRCVIGSVSPGESYSIRLRWALREADRVGPWNSQSAFIQAVAVERVMPTRPFTFSVIEHATGTRIVSFALPGDSDTAGAIVRYSTNSATAWAGMTALHNGVLTASPFYTTDPDAGLTYFEARTINTDGVVSTAGRRVSITLGSPPQGRDVRWRGAWASGTEYETQDGVSDRGNSFIALQDHTASAANRPNEDGTSNAYWGLLAAAGFAGEDGNGVEYVFAATASATISASQRPSNSWGFDEPGAVGGLQWHDGAPGLNEDDEYLWQAQRRAVGQPDVGDAISDNFSAPVIVGRWGVNGADGVEGADGADGNGVEYVFTVTSALRDAIPGSSAAVEFVGVTMTPGTRGGVTWDDGAPSIIRDRNPVSVAERARSGPGRSCAVGTAVSDSWGSRPLLSGAGGIDGIAWRRLEWTVSDGIIPALTDGTDWHRRRGRLRG